MFGKMTLAELCIRQTIAREIIKKLEEKLKNDSDYNKGIQDAINIAKEYLK
jgi:hypothetical protein